jgi:hypothetical protein
MGQAKRRRAQVDGWKANISPTEMQIANAAQRLLERFIEPDEATGMCYRMTFLLHLPSRPRHQHDAGCGLRQRRNGRRDDFPRVA